MSSDERRERLLRSGVELLSRRPHREISVEEIAEGAGVAKGLLYHYFPSKTDFIVSALGRGQAELADCLAADPSLPAGERFEASLSSFFDCLEKRPSGFASMSRGGREDPRIAAALRAGRAEQLARLMESLADWEGAPIPTDGGPTLESALQGWLFFCEGAVMRWRDQGGLGREELRVLLRSALDGALLAAAASEAASS